METTVETHTRRLKHLAQVLRDVGKRENVIFDMMTWGYHRGEHEPTQENHCGTVACALGWAALDPEFNKEGLVGRWKTTALDPGAQRLAITLHGEEPDGDERDYFDIGAEFFGLDMDEVGHMFAGVGTATDVAARAEAFALKRSELEAEQQGRPEVLR